MTAKPIKKKLKTLRFHRASTLLKGPIKTGWGVAIITAMILGGFLTCSKKTADKWSTPQVIKVDTGQKVYNYNRTNLYHYASYRHNRPSGTLVKPGDLISTTGKGDDMFFFPYRESDGRVLSFKIENSSRLQLDGKIISLQLNENGREWLAAAADEDIASLRFMEIRGDIDQPALTLLKKTARANPHVGLALDNKNSAGQVVPLFKPKIAAGLDGESLKECSPYLQESEHLIVEFSDASILNKLSTLPRLRTLTLSLGKESPQPVFPPGNRLTHLKVLSVLGMKTKKIGDISGIGELKHLEELSIWIKGIEDLDFLAALTELRTLSLSFCENLKGISFLKKLTKLAWLGFPANISQEDFNTAINEHPGLQVVELIDCKNITDLTALTKLPGLKAVIIAGDTSANIEVLEQIKDLQLAALPEAEFTDGPSEKVEKLEKALPNCIIVETGACMGSGWILLLFPAVFLSLLLRRKMRKGTEAHQVGRG